MTRFSSKWILSHSTWYKFRRQVREERMTLIAPMVYLALVTWAIIKSQSAMDDSTLDRRRSRGESGFVRWRVSDLARAD
jgi:hypothetical protein